MTTNDDYPAHLLDFEAVRMAREMARRWKWSAQDWREFLGFMAVMSPKEQRASVGALYDDDSSRQAWRRLQP